MMSLSICELIPDCNKISSEMLQLQLLLLLVLVYGGVNGISWLQRHNDINGEAAQDLAGNAVSISGDGLTLAVGAPENNGNGENAGHVRVYRDDGGAWTQLGDDIDGEAAGDQFVRLVLFAVASMSTLILSLHARATHWHCRMMAVQLLLVHSKTLAMALKLVMCACFASCRAPGFSLVAISTARQPTTSR
jgi:hypothetical protein